MRTGVDVLILDEPVGLNPTFRATLEHMPALHTVGEAELLTADSSGSVALVFVEEGRLPDGIARLADLKKRLPHLRALVSFEALRGADLQALLSAGADAFIARGATPGEVASAIRALAEGADRLVQHEMPAASPPDGADCLGLTPREAEVLRFLSAGFSNKEVARRLTLSVRTVETHRLNLRRKTQTGRLKDLVSLARQLGLDPVVDREPIRANGARH